LVTVRPNTGFSDRKATQANNKTAIPNKVRSAPKKRLNCVLSIWYSNEGTCSVYKGLQKYAIGKFIQSLIDIINPIIERKAPFFCLLQP